MKVLIIDDSKILRKRLIDMISDIDGIETCEAEDSDEALDFLKKRRPDVIILDIRLQGESGIAILERIKKSRPDTKVIMFTNYPYPQYRKKCKALGADYFLDKSTEFEKVTRILKRWAQGASPNTLLRNMEAVLMIVPLIYVQWL